MHVGLGGVAQWMSVYLACVKTEVQTLALQEQTKLTVVQTRGFKISCGDFSLSKE